MSALLDTVTTTALDPGLALLPEAMDSPEARRMLLAIGLQESRFQHRRQLGGGPARGYWQFELGGVAGLLTHHATRDHVRTLCDALNYAIVSQSLYDALPHNDVLAAALARLNLWWLPKPLPDQDAEGWRQYLQAWRPGRPHPDTWLECWSAAHDHVYGAPGGAPAD